MRLLALTLFALFTVLPTSLFADVYRWEDKNGRSHYSDSKPAASQSIKVDLIDTIAKVSKVKLDVPVIRQGKSLCGPATLEMLLRYWGITQYDQYDIAYNIINFRPELKRIKSSGILKDEIIDWNKYPGTGTRAPLKNRVMSLRVLKRLATRRNTKSMALVLGKCCNEVDECFRARPSGPSAQSALCVAAFRQV